MKDTIQLTRSPKEQKALDEYLEKLEKADVGGLFDERSVDYLRADGWEIERMIELGAPFYCLRMKFPYVGVERHFVLYAGVTDYALMGIDPELALETHPRHPTFRGAVRALLGAFASLTAQKKGYTNVAIVSREIPNSRPYIELLVYGDKESPKRQGDN